MQDIPNYDSFTQIRPIRKGWSGEEKYYIETREGERLFLRLADAGELGRKQLEFALLEQAHALGVPMPKPLNVGLCREGRRVYSLFTWCEGEDAEEVLPSLSEAEQYQLGLRAGEHLRLLHAVPVPQGMASWEEHFNRKLDRKLKQYADCPLSFAGDTHVLRYLEENRPLLAGRPRCFQHGDYHVGNMVIGGAGLLSLTLTALTLATLGRSITASSSARPRAQNLPRGKLTVTSAASRPSFSFSSWPFT